VSATENLQRILGLNCRNIDYVSRYNRRDLLHLVDNKLETKKVLQRAGIPHPRLLRAYEWFWELDGFSGDLDSIDTCVLKPSRGLSGAGVLVLRREGRDEWHTPSGHRYTPADLARHASDILYGVYSIDNTTDTALLEKRIVPSSFFTRIAPAGIADIRVIVFGGEPVMAMSRFPTWESDGKANVTLGAVGAGVDLATGEIISATTKRGPVETHPDSGVRLRGKAIPLWSEVLRIASRIQDHVALGYLGVDIVIDENEGALVLELNARPGLEIQNANGRGLKRLLQRRGSPGEAPAW